MPPDNPLSLVVKIENIQYGKRAYGELHLVLQDLIKECVIKKQPSSVSIACKTEATRSLYSKYLHGKKLVLLNKECILRIEGMDDTNCGEKENGSENESEGEDQGGDGGEDDGDDEGDLDDAPQNSTKGVVEEETVKETVGKVSQDSNAPLRNGDKHSTTFRAQGWRPIGGLEDIIGSSDTSNAFAEMALYWVQLLAQKNSLSPSDIDLVAYKTKDHFGVRANFDDKRRSLGFFNLNESHQGKALVEFIILEDRVRDCLPVHQTSDHTSQLQGICAALVQSGYPVTVLSYTQKVEFDDREGNFGFHYSEKTARECRARLQKNGRKCGDCCGTRFRVGGHFSGQRIPAKSPKWIQKDDYHSWVTAFFDLAISAGLKAYIPKPVPLKPSAARTPESKINSGQPKSTPALKNNSSSRILEETHLPFRPLTPSVNEGINPGPSIGAEDPLPIGNVETKSSLAYELVDRVVENSHKLMEAEKIIENQKSLILQQAQSLDRQKKSTQEWEKRVSEEQGKTASVQKQLGQLYKSNHRLIDRHKTQISDMVKTLQAKESLLSRAEERNRALEVTVRESELQIANNTIIGYQLKEKEGELKLAIDKISTQQIRIREIHSEKNEMGKRLRDLQADYDIQGRNLRNARLEKEAVINAMQEAGYVCEKNNDERKRGPSHEDDHNAKKVKTEQ